MPNSMTQNEIDNMGSRLRSLPAIWLKLGDYNVCIQVDGIDHQDAAENRNDFIKRVLPQIIVATGSPEAL